MTKETQKEEREIVVTVKVLNGELKVDANVNMYVTGSVLTEAIQMIFGNAIEQNKTPKPQEEPVN